MMRPDPTPYDELEVRDPADRERALFAALPRQIAHARGHAPFFAERLADVDPSAVDTRAALAELPVTRKAELAERQLAHPPFGGLNATPLGRMTRVFQSPGPIYEPHGRHPDPARFARALHAAGFRPGDLVHNGFSYHFTPGAWMLEGGLHRLGCAVFPAGVGQTELQARTIAHLRPSAYVGTPSFLKIILEKADELGVDCSAIGQALVSGEALPPSLRAWFAARGVAMLQAYATADVGLIAYETRAQGEVMPGMLVDEEVIIEIVEPNGSRPMPDGEVGEVVVTVFDTDYPLIRFATGDLSAWMPDANSPCGRTGRRLRGWLGRADQTTKIRGMFVHPGQLGEILRRHAEARHGRIVVEGTIGDERMQLLVESAEGAAGEALAAALAETVREVTKLRCDVVFTAPGSLPDDGKLIDDRRRYD